MAKKAPKKWVHRVDNKMRGAYGETDLTNKRIRINKKAIKRDRKRKGFFGIPKRDLTVIGIATHELLHKKHPKMPEHKIRKAARRAVARMNRKDKQKIYSFFK